MPPLLQKLRFDLQTLSGSEKNSGEPLRILYGGWGLERAYLSDLCFSEYTEQPAGRSWLHSLQKNAGKQNADLTIIGGFRRKLYKLLPMRQTAFIPAWVNQVIDFSEFSEALKKQHNLRKSVRRIRNRNLEHRITTDEAAFRSFYDTYYVPYVEMRYGSQAAPMSYHDAFHKYRSELTSVWDGEEFYAGNVIQYREDGPALSALGFSPDSLDRMRLGSSVLLHHDLEHLKKSGQSSLNMGYSRPVLHDGVYYHKRIWAARSRGTQGFGFLVRIHRISPAVESLLRSNPVIAMHKNQLCATYFVSDKDTEIDESVSALAKKHRTEKEMKQRVIDLASQPGRVGNLENTDYCSIQPFIRSLPCS